MLATIVAIALNAPPVSTPKVPAAATPRLNDVARSAVSRTAPDVEWRILLDRTKVEWRKDGSCTPTNLILRVQQAEDVFAESAAEGRCDQFGADDESGGGGRASHVSSFRAFETAGDRTFVLVREEGLTPDHRWGGWTIYWFGCGTIGHARTPMAGFHEPAPTVPDRSRARFHVAGPSYSPYFLEWSEASCGLVEAQQGIDTK